MSIRLPDVPAAIDMYEKLWNKKGAHRELQLCGSKLFLISHIFYLQETITRCWRTFLFNTFYFFEIQTTNPARRLNRSEFIWENLAEASFQPPADSVFTRSQFSTDSLTKQLLLQIKRQEVPRWEGTAPSGSEKPPKKKTKRKKKRLAPAAKEVSLDAAVLWEGIFTLKEQKNKSEGFSQWKTWFRFTLDWLWQGFR